MVEEFRARDAVFMGTAQLIALQPGSSRSGLTITAGRWLGFDRDSAARLSFLMALPITAHYFRENWDRLPAHSHALQRRPPAQWLDVT